MPTVMIFARPFVWLVCSVIILTTVLSYGIGIAGWIYREKAYKHPVLRRWKESYEKESELFYKPLIAAHELIESMPEGPERQKVWQWLGSKRVARYRIDRGIEISFVQHYSKLDISSNVQFAILCTPSNEALARRFGDLILSERFKVPTRFSFEIIVLKESEPFWDLRDSDDE